MPTAGAFETVRKLLELTAEFGEGSFLLVLKLFGDEPSPGVLSFPLPGATLALDFPNKGESTRRLLDRMADVVLAAGGRLYPAKDATMSRCGVPRRLSRLAQGRGAARPENDVRLLAPRDRGGRMKILILGATSAIAQAYARRRAQGCDFVLAARREDRLDAVAADLMASGAASAETIVADLAALERIEQSASDLRARFGAIDEVVVAYGVLGEQAAAEQDLSQARALIDSNFTSAALWVLALLKGRPRIHAVDHRRYRLGRGRQGPRQQFHLRFRESRASTASSRACSRNMTARPCASSG